MGRGGGGGPHQEGGVKLGHHPVRRVLLCAQSNGAIDELTARLGSDGVWGPEGARRKLGLVRMGRCVPAWGMQPWSALVLL